MATLKSPLSEILIDKRLMRSIRDVIALKPHESLVDWSENKRILPVGERKPGPYRFDNTPWMREITERLDSTDPCTDVVLMSGTQIGKTEAGNNWAGWVMDTQKGRFLCVQPTVEAGKRHVRMRINKMIASTPSLNAIVAKRNAGKGANTLLEKEFPGGIYAATGANSSVGIRSMASPRIHFDEFEIYPPDVDGEGDPVEVAKRRSDSFGHDRKHFYTSTPGDEDTSRVEPLFLSSDRNRYYIPCTHCGHKQLLRWAQVQWDKSPHRPETARYVCESCEAWWTDADRIQATREGIWIPDRAWLPHMPRGYHINSLYSHTLTMAQLAQERVEAQSVSEKLVTFINTRLGETWKDSSIYEYDSESLMSRREAYDYPAPLGVQLVTAGVDVQEDRLEMSVAGWGWGEEMWSLGHYVLFGDTSGKAVWDDLTGALSQPYQGVSQVHYISAVGVDSGYNTNMVYNYCLSRDGRRTRRVWPTKGGNDIHAPIWSRKPERPSQKKMTPYLINTFQIKKAIFSRLNNRPPGQGTIHFSTGDCHNADYFEQLTSESLRARRVRGSIKRDWVLRRGARNEVLDCTVNAFAAMKGMMRSGFNFVEPELPSVEVQAESGTEQLAEPAQDVSQGQPAEAAIAAIPVEPLHSTGNTDAEAQPPVSHPTPPRRRRRGRRTRFVLA